MNEASNLTGQSIQQPYYETGERIAREIPVAPENPIPLNQIRGVSITQLSYGYNVQVGCQTFAFETAEKVIANLASYMANPSQVEEKWFKKELKF